MKAKRFFSLTSAVLLLLSVLCACVGCGEPPLDSVKDRLIGLIDASAEVNELLWGAGLPYYAEDSEFAVENHLYDGGTQLGDYRYVTAEAKYHTVGEVQDLAHTVYADTYLDDIESILFDGYVDTASGHMAYARYLQTAEGLCILSTSENLLPGKRVYDYDTMTVVSKLSSGEILTVDVESALEDGTSAMTVRLRFVVQNGEWYLDSPTY